MLSIIVFSFSPACGLRRGGRLGAMDGLNNVFLQLKNCVLITLEYYYSIIKLIQESVGITNMSGLCVTRFTKS